MGDSRQRADLDAHAVYLNALRWAISGDTQYADCAVRICNDWSSAVDQVPSGHEICGLGGIPIFHFALAAELLRVYPGWEPEDFNRFKTMMVQYGYPVCHDFLENHNGRCLSFYWANWDAANIGAIIAIGVLCDNQDIFDEGVEYFKNGEGMGSIRNAVPYLHRETLGQWQESGRDQEHAQLGVGLLGSACQVAWNQGGDLFGYDHNRLLAGAEYVAKTNLSYSAETIPYRPYNNCANANQLWLSINGLGRLDDRPVWELMYSHYVVRKGIAAPYVQAVAELMRPEHGSKDHFGYGSLTYTLDASASPYPPALVPATPTGLKAEGGVARIFLEWDKSPNDSAQGYVVYRGIRPDGPFEKVVEWTERTLPQYTDTSVINGVTYYYRVAAINQSGIGVPSEFVIAQSSASGPLPSGWSNSDIGQVAMPGSATYAEAGQNTFIAQGAGGQIGGKADALNLTRRMITGDFSFTARLIEVTWSGRDKIGLMVRETLEPEARAVALTLGQLGNRQCRFGVRLQSSSEMTWQAGNDYTWTPVWFRIQRTGDVFIGYQSCDGTNWFTIGSCEVPMSESCTLGFAITGQKPDRLNTSLFDHVVVTASRD